MKSYGAVLSVLLFEFCIKHVTQSRGSRCAQRRGASERRQYLPF